MVIQMLSIGEEAGSLDHMLDKIATFYEEDVDNAVDNLSSLLEPMIMVILGVLVGGLVIAMYLPDLPAGPGGWLSNDRIVNDRAAGCGSFCFSYPHCWWAVF